MREPVRACLGRERSSMPAGLTMMSTGCPICDGISYQPSSTCPTVRARPWGTRTAK